MDLFDSCDSLPQTTTTTTAAAAAATTTDDFMDATLNLPETQMKEGYKDGLTKGKLDAYEVGLKHGFECGQEIGFYRGIVDVWTAVIWVEPEFFSSRVKKSVKQFNELLHEYPLLSPEDETKDVFVDKTRLKFKAICASLGLKLEYKGYPNPKFDHAREF